MPPLFSPLENDKVRENIYQELTKNGGCIFIIFEIFTELGKQTVVPTFRKERKRGGWRKLGAGLSGICRNILGEEGEGTFVCVPLPLVAYSFNY